GGAFERADQSRAVLEEHVDQAVDLFPQHRFQVVQDGRVEDRRELAPGRLGRCVGLHGGGSGGGRRGRGRRWWCRGNRWRGRAHGRGGRIGWGPARRPGGRGRQDGRARRGGGRRGRGRRRLRRAG